MLLPGHPPPPPRPVLRPGDNAWEATSHPHSPGSYPPNKNQSLPLPRSEQEGPTWQEHLPASSRPGPQQARQPIVSLLPLAPPRQHSSLSPDFLGPHEAPPWAPSWPGSQQRQSGAILTAVPPTLCLPSANFQHSLVSSQGRCFLQRPGPGRWLSGWVAWEARAHKHR